MDGVPVIPKLAPTESASGGLATGQDIASILAPIQEKATAPLPSPYAQGVQVAEAHQKQIVPYEPVNENHRPLSDQATSLRIARHQNATAGLANMIGKFGQKLQEQKQANLKDKIVDVMKAKQNVANANQVLSQDPNNEMAKKVLEANKKQLNNILSDPKHQKELAKAFDISYVDPEKNKTPEIQAAQAAAKEFKAAGQFNSDNPQEHQVADMASRPPNLPAPKSPQVTQNPMTARPNLPAPTAPNVSKSTTPYADAALAKDMPTISENPQYNLAVQQQQQAQKQMAAMVPKLIEAESKAQLQAVKDDNAGARLQYKSAMDFRTRTMQALAKLQGIDAENATKLKVQASRSASELGAATIRANAITKVAELNGMSKETVAGLKTQGAADLDKKINTVTTTLKSYGQREADIKSSSLPEEEKKKQLDMLDFSRQQDANMLAEYQKLRAEKFPDIPPPQMAQPTKPDGPGLLHRIFTGVANIVTPEFEGKKDANSTGTSGPASSSQADKPTRVDAVGSDDSDESGNDEDDDSDKL
jgi:hypothetical protein